MSSDIAGIPPWKMALMERKRRNEKDNGSSVGRQEQSLDINGLPSWKRDIIVKKHQQKNTLVFMAKLPSNSNYDFEPDQSENRNELSNSVPTFTNGCCDSSENNKHNLLPPDFLLPAAGSEISNTNSSSQNVPECDKKGEADDRPIEERLLPIRRNPILRLDIAKRHSSSSHSVRHSWSPRSGSDTFIGLGQPSVSEQTSPNVFPPVEKDGDVFSEGDNDAEVAYGRGFVHKLLMKFSHLSTSDQPVIGHVSPRQSGSSQSRLSVGSPSSPGKGQFADAESLQRKPLLFASRAKCHSVDDLLRDSDTHSLRSDYLDNIVEVRKNCDLGYVNSTDSITKLSTSARKIDAVEVKELPLINTVSNTRSLFENLVASPRLLNSVSHSGLHENLGTSPRQSNAVPHGNVSNHLISVDSMDKINVKSVEIPISVSSVLLRKEVNQDGLETKWSNQTSNKQNLCETEQAFVQDQKSSQCVSSDKAVPVQLVTATKLQSKNDKGVTDQSAEYVTLPAHASLNGYRINGQNHISDGAVVNKLPVNSTVVALKTLNDNNIRNGHVVALENSIASNNHDRFNPAPAAVSDNQVSSSIFPKVRPNVSALDTQNDVSQENKSIAQSMTKSTAAKNAPSRPGMLLIRPASNLVAAKTKTEYLSLTKYNDVRKGEFAPAAKKSVEQLVDNESIVEVEPCISDSVAEPSCDQRIVFSGAGIHLNRSLLDKTRQGNHLQLKFDDALTSTFEYPSEQSLMDASPAQPGDCDFDPAVSINPSASTGLRTSLISGASAGALSSYRSRMQVDYQFGMHVQDDPKPEPVVAKQKVEPVKPPEQETPMWSKGASADLLF